MQVPHTHDRSINEVLYNKELHQVITVCTESVVKVWEMETGKLVYQITEAHGANVEVTAIGIDKTGYRLVTGAVDGMFCIIGNKYNPKYILYDFTFKLNFLNVHTKLG